MRRDPLRQSASGIAALRAHGCMLFSSLWVAGWATDGTAIPNGQDAIDSVVAGLRKSAGMTAAQFDDRGTTLDEAERAFEALTVPGYMPLRMRKFHGGSLRDDILPELRKGNAALVAVNYGVIQDAGRGIGSFRGGHALVILNLDNGKVDVIDPLRSEVIRLDVDLIETAMERFGENPWGNGRGEAGVVSRALTWKEGYEVVKADLATATATLSKRTTERNDARRDRETAQAAADLATAAAGELRGQLSTALARIGVLEETPVDCSGPVATATQVEHDRMVALVESGAAALVARIR